MRLFVIEGCAGILVFHLDVSGISADSSLYPCVQNVLREILPTGARQLEGKVLPFSPRLLLGDLMLTYSNREVGWLMTSATIGPLGPIWVTLLFLKAGGWTGYSKWGRVVIIYNFHILFILDVLHVLTFEDIVLKIIIFWSLSLGVHP